MFHRGKARGSKGNRKLCFPGKHGERRRAKGNGKLSFPGKHRGAQGRKQKNRPCASFVNRSVSRGEGTRKHGGWKQKNRPRASPVLLFDKKYLKLLN